jgi:hypothetical protein
MQCDPPQPVNIAHFFIQITMCNALYCILYAKSYRIFNMDESIAVVSKYVSKKISKVRWRPTSKHIVQTPTIFAAGSWDDEVGSLNLYTDL